MSRLRAVLRRPWVRWVALALIVPLPAFILVCNILLWTGAIEALVSREAKEHGKSSMQLEHGFAWMLWPTRVHLSHAHLTIDAYSYQMVLDMDETFVDLSLLALLDHRAHFERIETTGLRAQYRVKVDPADANAPQLAAYPPFDGTDVQVQSAEPKPVPAPEDAWTIDLDDVDAQVDALWIDEFNLEPAGHVQGGMHWTDYDDFSVPTTTVTTEGATLWLADNEAVRDLVGEGTLTIDTFDSGEIPGDQIPAYMSFAYRGEGVVVEPAGLAIWWPDVAGMVAGDPGPVEVDVSAEAGVLAVGTRIHHHTPRAEVGPRMARLVGETDLVLEIEADGRPSATVTVAEPKLVGEAGELAHGATMRGIVHVTHGDMTKPWTLASTHVETGEVVVPKLAKLAALAGEDGWKIKRGSASGHAVLDIGPDKIPMAETTVRLDDAVMVAGSVEISASVRTNGRVRRMPDGEIIADGITARTSDVKIKTDGGTSGGTWARLRDTKVRWKDGELTVDAHGRIEDARPAAVHLTRLDPVIDAMPDLGRLEAITAHTKLRVGKDLLEIDLRAEQLGLKVAALWRKRGKDWRLAIWLSGLTAFGFTATEDQKVRRPLVLVGKDWYDTQRRWVRQLATPRQG